MPMGAFGAGMFNPMWMGGKGMMQMADWWQNMVGEGGKNGEGGAPAMPMPGFGAGMFPPMWPPSWPGLQGGDGPWSGRDGDDDRRRRGGSRRGRSGDRSRDRRDRSRSDDRGKSVDYMRLPRQIMGRVIGKQGQTINGIREASGARVDAEDKNDDMCEFKIQGTPEAVERAKAMIVEVAEKSRSDGASGAADGAAVASGTGTSETLEFPVALMGGIIGMRGSKISDVRQQSGAKVQVEKGEGRCKVTMSGTPEQVERAKELVRSLAEEESGLESGRGGQPRSDSWGSGGGSMGGNSVSNTLEFPVAATGRIIGSRGAQISEVRQQSGARVSVEKLEDCCKVMISGTPEQVDRARKLLVALADEGQGVRRSEASDQMEVPLSMVGRVIGKGGDTIQRLQRESGARLDVNTNEGDPCLVRISGSRDACSRARFLIAEVLDRGSQPGDRGGGPPGAWGPEAAAPWGPLPGFPAPPFGGLPPPGDGNGSQWQPPWGGVPMPGMWGYPSGGCWDYPGGDASAGSAKGGEHEQEHDRDRLCDRDRGREHEYDPEDAQPREVHRPRREIDLDEL